MKLNVLVTGAAGRTGRLVLENLLSDKDTFEPRGLVRSFEKAKESLEDHYAKLEPVLVEGDVTRPDTLVSPMTGIEALVILVSAVPKMHPPVDGQPPSFYFEKGGMPETVDWIGAKNQIDLAKRLGVSHVLLVGSMGSSNDNDPLNRVGDGNILRFKRKAEQYLIDSGLTYTIVNPGGLRNEPAGERELLVGRNDELFSIYSRSACSIPRADVARIVVSALTAEDARNKAFDVVGRPKGDGIPTADVSALFATTGPTL